MYCTFSAVTDSNVFRSELVFKIHSIYRTIEKWSESLWMILGHTEIQGKMVFIWRARPPMYLGCLCKVWHAFETLNVSKSDCKSSTWTCLFNYRYFTQNICNQRCWKCYIIAVSYYSMHDMLSEFLQSG